MNGHGLRAAVRRRAAVLRNADLRRMLAGHAVSVLGDGLYAVAAMWLVYDLTGSTAYTGIAGFLTRVPGVLKLFVGPVVDRLPLGRALTLSEFAQAVLVLGVPLAAVLGHLNVAVVLTVMPLLALANLLTGPAQNATLPRLVSDENLVRANSAAQVTAKSVDAAARGVAGALIAVSGAVALYVVDAATFVVAGLLYWSLSIPPRDGETAAQSLDLDSYLADLREGVALLGESIVGKMLAASLFANFLTGVTLAVLPAFADAVGGPETYGLLLAATTVGIVLGSVAASAVDEFPLGATTIVGFAASGLLWTLAVVVPGRLATVALFALSRVPAGVYNVSVSATIQTGVPDDLLGRVTAVVGSASSLVVPAGMLLGGLAGSRFGSRTVMLASALGSVLAGTYWLGVPSLRRFGPPTRVTSGEFGDSGTS
ncbi:MFS transporter [Halorussus sp. MSC15.2]|uniref:MFS transporter n=1 Tax=Halorussus sp. MSC15.2 TaxID=2283638 RepID=UPI0013D51B23|nr:MFS transporter [Halorussus sp. MSC15.2]NEU59043.1 MFS transporter [Halorussus sp. MSC15.2]